MSYRLFASVVVDAALDKPLDYGIRPEQIAHIARGSYVEVPLRGRSVKGYVLEIKEHPSFPKVLPISKILSPEALLSSDLFELALWITRYYCTPLSKVLRTMMPASIRNAMAEKTQATVVRVRTREELISLCAALRRESPAQAQILDVMLKVKKGILLTELLEQAGTSRSPVETLVSKGLLALQNTVIDRKPSSEEDYFPTRAKNLSPEQQIALGRILEGLKSRRFETHLLHGVTGSGKTEVYLQSIQKALELDLGSVLLVPEISLTAQTVERLLARFGTAVAILHHRLSEGERRDAWQALRRGETKVVVGPRSAIFSPVQNLGLIVIDEEHDPAYKQTDENPCYHGRDVAVMRAKISNCPVILGSATPSLESYHNAQKGKYILSKLVQRPGSTTLPRMTLVDMKRESEGGRVFSNTLLDAIKRRLTLGEQTILFLNRRGYHTSRLCKGCGYVFGCPHCDVSLSFHKSEDLLSCHLCRYSLQPPPVECPECHRTDLLRHQGVGTEQVEKALYATLPDLRILRMDADTTRHKGSHEKHFRAFRSGKADVLIGTQMVTKGLHFPAVTLVGVLNSDTSLSVPDFRASELTFQLVTQVAGRAGRGAMPGEVIVQTWIPESEIIQLAANQDYDAFYAAELSSRETFAYPPFTRLVKLRFSSTDEKRVFGYASTFHATLMHRLPVGYEASPVVPAGHAKVKDVYRFHFLTKGASCYRINQALLETQQLVPAPKSVSILVDVDPLNTFF